MNPVLEFLRDQVWQFVGAFLALVALVVTIILYRKQRQPKALTYEVVSAVPVLSVSNEIKKQVQILFNGVPISDAHLAVIRVVNSGQVPVVTSDYERPIVFDFGDGTQVLSADVVNTKPEDLPVELVFDANKVTIKPLLLNPKNWMLVKVLITPAGCKTKASARIVGVEFKEKSPARRVGLNSILLWAAFLLGLLGNVLTSVFGAVGLLGLLIGALGVAAAIATLTGVSIRDIAMLTRRDDLPE